jgi:hypothetical protein
MAENAPNIQVRQYLDYQGLQTLWEKISDTYIRKAGIVKQLSDVTGGLIDNENDIFIRNEVFQDQIAILNEAIESIKTEQGSNFDEDTIIKNNGKLQTNIILAHDEANHIISLITDVENGGKGTVINEISYDNFYKEAVKDGMLKNVSLVYVPSEGNPTTEGREAGTYLKFEFNTDSGLNTIYLNVNDLIDVYEGGDYILIENKIDEADGETRRTTISFDKAKLIKDIQDGDELGINAIISDVENLQARVQTLEGTIDTLNKDWEEFGDTLAALAERMTDAEGKITELVEFKDSFVRIEDSEIEALE